MAERRWGIAPRNLTKPRRSYTGTLWTRVGISRPPASFEDKDEALDWCEKLSCYHPVSFRPFLLPA
jgi:hypothetical protein